LRSQYILLQGKGIKHQKYAKKKEVFIVYFFLRHFKLCNMLEPLKVKEIETKYQTIITQKGHFCEQKNVFFVD